MNATQTPGELVRERPGRARVLDRIGILYNCEAEGSLADACRQNGLMLDHILGLLAASDKAEPLDGGRDWTGASMGELVDNIIAEHHDYLREELPRLSRLLGKLAANHADQDPNLPEVETVFTGLRQELELHLAKEEQVLFPIIRQIEAGNARAASHCGSVRNPIFVMEREHVGAKEALAKLSRLTNAYTAPEWACTTHVAVIESLGHLDNDLNRHIYKEDVVLFPKAIATEAAA
ncbi:MAG TPA: hemerythrin domain-containing protein [Armatimonadota bacterium]|jgi:regulator of cell morphogenesis and NO signaling